MKNYQLIALTVTTLAGTLFHASAHALTISLNNYDSVGGGFSYDVTLAPNEFLEEGFDFLYLKNLAGVTAINAYSPYSADGFDSTSADFIVSTTVNSLPVSQTFENVIFLTSNNPVGTIDYEASSDFFASDFESNVQGPVASVAVPFKLSPDFSFFAILCVMGINYCRKNLKF